MGSVNEPVIRWPSIPILSREEAQEAAERELEMWTKHGHGTPIVVYGDRCPLCGSEVNASEGIQPPRLVCSRRACEGEVWL